MNKHVPIVVTEEDIKRAKLPETYKAAIAAIERCEAIDECQEWNDRHMAIASYARQAKDKTLLNHAIRVQANAVRRMGDLIKIVPSAKGKTRKGGAPLSSSPRRKAIEAAGVSEEQAKQALRVSNIPKGSFDQQVNAANPPTVTALAQQGTKRRARPSSAEIVEDVLVVRRREVILAVVNLLRDIPTQHERVDFRRQLLEAISDKMVGLGDASA